MDIYLDQKRLDQLSALIGEMPTKYGLNLAVLLTQWAQEALAASQVPDPTPDVPEAPVEEPTVA